MGSGGKHQIAQAAGKNMPAMPVALSLGICARAEPPVEKCVPRGTEPEPVPRDERLPICSGAACRGPADLKVQRPGVNDGAGFGLVGRHKDRAGSHSRKRSQALQISLLQFHGIEFLEKMGTAKLRLRNPRGVPAARAGRAQRQGGEPCQRERAGLRRGAARIAGVDLRSGGVVSPALDREGRAERRVCSGRIRSGRGEFHPAVKRPGARVEAEQQVSVAEGAEPVNMVETIAVASSPGPVNDWEETLPQAAAPRRSGALGSVAEIQVADSADINRPDGLEAAGEAGAGRKGLEPESLPSECLRITAGVSRIGPSERDIQRPGVSNGAGFRFIGRHENSARSYGRERRQALQIPLLEFQFSYLRRNVRMRKGVYMPVRIFRTTQSTVGVSARTAPAAPSRHKPASTCLLSSLLSSGCIPFLRGRGAWRGSGTPWGRQGWSPADCCSRRPRNKPYTCRSARFGSRNRRSPSAPG